MPWINQDRPIEVGMLFSCGVVLSGNVSSGFVLVLALNGMECKKLPGADG
jgi:hypothetical protein